MVRALKSESWVPIWLMRSMSMRSVLKNSDLLRSNGHARKRSAPTHLRCFTLTGHFLTSALSLGEAVAFELSHRQFHSRDRFFYVGSRRT